jgi:hypothetical protein
MQRQSLKIIPPEDSDDNMQNTTHLSPEIPFLDFDLELTEEEKCSLEKMTITSQTGYINYGHLDNLLDEASEFINKLGEGNSEISIIIAKLIVRIVNQAITYFQENYNRETAIVEMRAFIPNPAFKIPRWHQDGYYFTQKEEDYKAVATIKGPGTLFYRPSHEEKEYMAQIKRDHPPITLDSNGKPDFNEIIRQSDEDRAKLANFFDKSKATSTAFGKGSIFISGSDYAAVHSEPDITSQRFFLSVTPGNKDKIQQRNENQKKIRL